VIASGERFKSAARLGGVTDANDAITFSLTPQCAIEFDEDAGRASSSRSVGRRRSKSTRSRQGRFARLSSPSNKRSKRMVLDCAAASTTWSVVIGKS